MGKPNLEYLRQYEFCKKMAVKAKLPDMKLAWLELAAKWLVLARSPLDAFKARQAATRTPGAALHLKKFAG